MNSFDCPHCNHPNDFEGEAGSEIMTECESCDELVFIEAVENVA